MLFQKFLAGTHGHGLEKKTLAKAKTGQKFIEALEQNGLVGPQNMRYIQYLLNELHSSDQQLLERIEKYIERPDQTYPFPQGVSSCGMCRNTHHV